MTDKIGGILAALSTPFADDSAIDENALRTHVDFLIDSGIHGLVPGGSTGEFSSQTVEERKLVNQIVLEQSDGRVPVAPHVGSTRTADAVELARHAAQHGATAVLAVQPYYEPPTRAEVIDYFATIGKSAELPVIAYNLPAVTGMNLDRAFYEELFEHTDAVKYVKDTSGSLEQAYDLIFNMEGRLGTLVGLDTILLPAFAAGAAGSIWGAPNFAPRECVEIYNLASSGKHDEALQIFRRIWNVLDFLGKEGYAVATKATAAELGIKLGAPRAPYAPLPPEKQTELAKLVDEAGLRAS